MRFKHTLQTNGTGHWSSQARNVTLTDIELGEHFNVKDDRMSGELRAYFTRRSWDVRRHGLVYTDPLFLKGFKAALARAGLPTGGVDYSEQGMQGDDYVSLDVDHGFIVAFLSKARR